MHTLKQAFIPRQYMVTPDFEYFHYFDDPTVAVEYHNHDFYEIYFFISGKVTYLIEGKSYKLKPGDILLINNREIHKPIVEQGQEYERVIIWVSPSFIKQNSTEECDLTMCFESSSKSKYNLMRPHSEMLGIMRSTLSRFEKACISNSYGNQVLKKVYLLEILVQLNRAFLETEQQNIEYDVEYNEKINNIILYINANLAGDLSLDYISNSFFMSKYHLLREFKKYTGYTIHRYIQQKRLIMSKALLREGIPVTEVCVKCGFGDYSNFIRAFKKTFGLSPREYYKTQLI